MECKIFSSALILAAVCANSATAAASYPVSEFRMGIYNSNRNISASDEDYITSSKYTGESSEKWTLNYISSGVYEIVNSATGQIVTNDNGIAVTAADKDGANQRWNIVAVQNDFDGYPLYYKITSNANSNLALTFNTNSNSFSLENYTGANLQKFKLNLDGLEGYAANAMTPAGEKAGTIGGLLGEVVYVSTDTDLIKQLDSEGPKTIVVTADIDMQKHSHTRIRDFKTLVGCYGKHTLYDPYFRTNNEYGKDEPSDNIVIKNFKMIAKNQPNRIMINVWSSRQIWIDHIYFESQLSYDRKGNGQDEVGKFIWINTPYESYYDAKDRTRSPDYVTISYSHLKNRYWTVAYGTQNDEITRDRTTLLYNWWDENVRRCPQLGNGSAHIYNNYYSAYGSGNNGSATSGIIGGDGSEMLSTNNRFNGYTLSQALMMGGGKDPSRDDNSYLSTGLNGTPSKVNFTPKTKSSWKPENSNYGYSLLDAYNTKGTDTKDFCSRYAGDQTSASNMKYITSSEFKNWITTRYESPFLKNLDVGDDPVLGKAGAVMDTTLLYTIKNVNSGLYLNAASSKFENGTDVVQTAESMLWTLSDAGDGYYTLHPKNGKEFFLDLSYGAKDNGTNIGLWQDTKDPAQYFKFVKNDDGTYTITTKNTKDKSCLGIGAASKEANASVIQWSCDGTANQNWNVTVTILPLEGVGFKNLMVQDTANSSRWGVVKNAEVGGAVFGDRDFTFTEISSEILNAEQILTACNSKNSTKELASFTTSEKVTVYVGLDSRVENKPAWLADWESSEASATSSNEVQFVFYEKTFDAGEVVTLGSNGQSSYCVNYVVMLKTAQIENSSETEPGDAGTDKLKGLTVAQGFAVHSNGRMLQVSNPVDEMVRMDLFDYVGRKLASFNMSGKGTFMFDTQLNLNSQRFFVKMQWSKSSRIFLVRN